MRSEDKILNPFKKAFWTKENLKPTGREGLREAREAWQEIGQMESTAAEKKMGNISKSFMKTGGKLTLMLTIPILLTIFLGVIGAVVGIVIFLVMAAAGLKSKN